MCLGSGRVAVGPWGVNPPKKTCPECSGRKRVPAGHRYQDPTVQPSETEVPAQPNEQSSEEQKESR